MNKDSHPESEEFEHQICNSSHGKPHVIKRKYVRLSPPRHHSATKLKMIKTGDSGNWIKITAKLTAITASSQ